MARHGSPDRRHDRPEVQLRKPRQLAFFKGHPRPNPMHLADRPPPAARKPFPASVGRAFYVAAKRSPPLWVGHPSVRSGAFFGERRGRPLQTFAKPLCNPSPPTIRKGIARTCPDTFSYPFCRGWRACEKNHTNAAQWHWNLFRYPIFITTFFMSYTMLFSQLVQKRAASGIVFAFISCKAENFALPSFFASILGTISYFDQIQWYAGHFGVP